MAAAPQITQNPECVGRRGDGHQQIDPRLPIGSPQCRKVNLSEQPLRHSQVVLVESELCGKQRSSFGNLLRQASPKGGESPDAELRCDCLAVARDEVIRRGPAEHLSKGLPHDLRLALFAAGRQKAGNVIR